MTKLSNGRWEQQNVRLTLACSWSLFPLGRGISTWWCVQPPRTWRSGSAGSRCPRWCAGLSSAPLAARCKRPPRGTHNSGSTARPQTRCPRSPPARPHWTQSGTFLQSQTCGGYLGCAAFILHRDSSACSHHHTSHCTAAEQQSLGHNWADTSADASQVHWNWVVHHSSDLLPLLPFLTDFKASHLQELHSPRVNLPEALDIAYVMDKNGQKYMHHTKNPEYFPLYTKLHCRRETAIKFLLYFMSSSGKVAA